MHRFEVYEIEGAAKGKSPYQIVEDIDVESFKQWQKVVSSEAMKEVVTTWSNYAGESTVKLIFDKKIK